MGIPTAQICTITSIAASIGVPRIVPEEGIPFPVGNPSLDAAAEKKLRRGLVLKALQAISQPASGPSHP